jgi:hypothetical protein
MVRGLWAALLLEFGVGYLVNSYNSLTINT